LQMKLALERLVISASPHLLELLALAAQAEHGPPRMVATSGVSSNFPPHPKLATAVDILQSAVSKLWDRP